MAIDSIFPIHHNMLNLKVSNKDYSENFPKDRIFEFNLEEFRAERGLYAENQIFSYQKKIDKLYALNHPKMRPKYINQINKHILIERGELFK